MLTLAELKLAEDGLPGFRPIRTMLGDQAAQNRFLPDETLHSAYHLVGAIQNALGEGIVLVDASANLYFWCGAFWTKVSHGLGDGLTIAYTKHYEGEQRVYISGEFKGMLIAVVFAVGPTAPLAALHMEGNTLHALWEREPSYDDWMATRDQWSLGPVKMYVKAHEGECFPTQNWGCRTLSEPNPRSFELVAIPPCLFGVNLPLELSWRFLEELDRQPRPNWPVGKIVAACHELNFFHPGEEAATDLDTLRSGWGSRLFIFEDRDGQLCIVDTPSEWWLIREIAQSTSLDGTDPKGATSQSHESTQFQQEQPPF